MADDRSTPQCVKSQAQTIGHASPPPPAPAPVSITPSAAISTSCGQSRQDSPPRGPRTLLLRRSENGFGFTLRHFIVYPPESCYMLPGHERTKIDEPMDTIFVKQVRSNSPAAEAGLRTGDRLVAVDGAATRGEQYASVVQRIQQAGPWLRLLVVSKEDDILQRYFGETAHNPETNQRPRLRSPERLTQKQKRAIGMIPANTARARQSWICSPPGSENQGTVSHYGLRNDSLSASDDQTLANESSASAPALLQRKPHDDRTQRRTSPPSINQKEALDPSLRSNRTSHETQRYDLYDRTRPESIYSRTGSDRIYDKIKDPIYERVKPDSSTFTESLDRHRFPVSRAEPQVPIYRPGRRVVTRRASEGSGPISESEMAMFGSANTFDSRFSVDSRRDSSPASKDSSLSSFDSNSTLTGHEGLDNSHIMNRLKKSFEQKEEFLRRPSQPIGWLSNENPPPIIPLQTQSVIQREFYARPQKLQRQVWPPSEFQQQQQQFVQQQQKLQQQQQLQQQMQHQQMQQQLPRQRALAYPDERLKALKPSNQNLQRVQNSTDSDLEYSNANSNSNSNSQRRNEQIESNRDTRDRFYATPYDNNGSAKENHISKNGEQMRMSSNTSSSRNNAANKTAFITTLSRIHENVTSAAQQGQEARNGSSSLPSSPGLDKKGNDKFPVPPQGLQIVSRRAKQFESGKLMSDDDEPTSDRTNLYKSELSRLSNKRSVPNVAVRKREFESKAESQDPRRLAIGRESKSLDGGSGLSGNRSIPIGSKYIHCEPPSGYRKHTGSNEDADSNGVVLRRQKNAQISDEDRATRRVSYLKATWGERMHIDSDLELSDTEPVQSLRSSHKRWRPPLFPSDIAPLRRLFEEMTQGAYLHSQRHSHRNSILSSVGSNSGSGTPRDAEPIEREGSLHVKFTVLDGKRSSDRSWKQVWGVLRGQILYFYKDRHSQSPSTNGEGDTASSVDTRCASVDIAEDYTKRKHVLRITNSVTEVLLQTEDAASMVLWLRAFKVFNTEKPSSQDAVTNLSKQQAVPQTPGPTSNALQSGGQRLSPLPSHKGIRKLTSFRNRSPTGQSPVSKTRKPSQTVDLPSPKSKTWKGRMAKQFRRMHGQAGSPSSPTAQLPPEGATFKVPLELCPQSSFSEFVPLLVEMCTSIVEARGLEVIGIYRVPGNTAAISQLTESVNKGFENINLQDPRWSDVNVISSLLKSFFRQLPDSLLTAELYPMFIDADKVEDPQRRMATIRKLLRDLPEHHFETLKYLMFHLKKVVEHSEANKMEAKNLAIVFGPTLVRASGSRDNMVTMVTDMSHQCRIVESLLNNVDWFFSEEDLDDLSRLSVNLSLPADGNETDTANHNLLLNNIQKVEGMREMITARDIVSSIISAANRKIQRRRKGHDEPDNDDHEDEKLKGKHEENLPVVRQSMALNERQCSVSEIVLMHENKGQPSRSVGNGNGNNPPNNACNPRPKYSKNPSGEQQREQQQQEQQTSLPPSEPSKKSNDGPGSLDSVSTISNLSNDTKQSNDEVAIRTYAGLSATTQERIRRFEQETMTMLQRDQHRQRREAERREEERKRIEKEWQLAKSEMENDDILDSIVDTTVAPNFLSERLSSLNERLSDRSSLDLSDCHVRSKSSTRAMPLSIAVQQQPTARQKAQASTQLSNILGEKMNNGVIKKFKTDKEQSPDSNLLAPTRYGSLDSLHEIHGYPSSSPSQQHRGLPGDISDDGSDLLTSLTSTFDRKWKSLVNPTSQPPSFIETSSVTNVPAEVKEEKPAERTQARFTTEVYRDPSLHRSTADKAKSLNQKNHVPEKDSDSGIVDTTESSVADLPDNDRHVSSKKSQKDEATSSTFLDASEKDETVKLEQSSHTKKRSDSSPDFQDTPSSTSSPSHRDPVDNTPSKTDDSSQKNDSVDPSYSNKLKKFESMSQATSEPRSRLKRSESLNKRTENVTSKLKRSESLNKHSSDRPLTSPSNGKLKRSESLNKHSDRSESPNSKLKRSESLTKTEKTESNISKRRQSVRKESATKLKRKNGMPERSIKRRHTVGGTKDFDKVHWLDNKLQAEAEKIIKNDKPTKKSQLRTSSPDLSSNRYNLADTSFLIEVSFRGPSNVVFNVTNARPQSLPDGTLTSKVYKVPLESHV
ncbi:uncharacterized protein LOC117174310 isoform X12 [Belonocnema kinseyi]|uniref:uncharacterized protein LOC117174310 isoform X12 n=1 Tax=Belonocnema kinseyi TaxID=2817044 RepID=UPI00143DC8F4|nr:uncharacterized protein LOC117174310 isoform X12 [Belonocnema kinseyi]